MPGQALRDKAAIVGIGETEYVKRSPKSIQRLVLEAVERAAQDAGISVKDIDGIVLPAQRTPVTALELELNFGLRELRFAANAGIGGGAGVNAAAQLAAMAIDAGYCNHVLVWHALKWGSERMRPGEVHDAFPDKHDFETVFGLFGQPVYFALMARRHMHDYGTTSDQLGAIAVAHRRHALLNGNAVMKTPITLEDYRNSPFVAEPFRVLDCCLINDGAGAYIVTSAERARDLRQRPVYIAGAGQDAGHRSAYWTQDPQFTRLPAAQAAPRAYAAAGIAAKDADLFYCYDGFTWMVLSFIEDHGFCKKGEGGPFVEDGRIEVGGELPVNTNGGMLSQSYLQGMNHLCEAVRQLRGTAGRAQVNGAEVAVLAGLGASYCTLVLRK